MTNAPLDSLGGVGARLPRLDAREKVTGRASYIADLSRPNLLHAAIVASPHAHARILGYATEAAGALVEYGFRALRLHRIEAHVAPGNSASQKVVEKLGFQREGIAREFEFVNGRFLDHIQYSAMTWEVEGGRPGN